MSEHETSYLTPTYGRVLFDEEIPKDKLPENSHEPNAVYRFIRDELQLDGNPTLNMASFVTTVMDDEANRLISENLGKNYIDTEVYGRTAEIEQRCVKTLLDLYQAPYPMLSAEQLALNKGDKKSSWGTLAIGSSEALMLCALSHKRRWMDARKEQGLSTERPCIVLGSDVHITWVKFAEYFDVNIIWVPITKENNYAISAAQVRNVIEDPYISVDAPNDTSVSNKNIICVVAVMGTSYTGQNDPVKEINDVLVSYKNRQDDPIDIPLHVDAASGGFVEPFRQHDNGQLPKLSWDFSLEQVKTINVSGHKFGLVYPGIGWALWKDINDIPKALFVSTNVLGFDESTYSLNFSRGSAMVLGQYYNFLRLGKKGYCSVIQNLMGIAQHLSQGLKQLRVTVYESGADKPLLNDYQVLEIVNDASYFPACAAKLNLGQKPDGLNDKGYLYNEHNVVDKLKQSNWIVPAFTMPLNATSPIGPKDPNSPTVNMMRMVVKESFNWDMADQLIKNFAQAIGTLELQTRALRYPDKKFTVLVRLSDPNEHQLDNKESKQRTKNLLQLGEGVLFEQKQQVSIADKTASPDISLDIT